MLVDIDKIQVNDRIRKDFGNIQELADDINIHLKPNFKGINTCAYCGSPFVDKHHIIPKELMGEDCEENIIYICPNHHRILHFLIDLDSKELFGNLNKMNNNKFNQQFQQLKYIIAYESNVYNSYIKIIRPLLIEHLNNL